jgi:hypothetical protein
MQEIDRSTPYEVEPGLFQPPGYRRVLAEVAGERALGFRHDSFEEMAARIGRHRNPPLRPYPERCRPEPPPDIFEQSRRAG